MTSIEQRNETTVRNFCADWGKLSTEALLPYFATDGVYHNMPWPPLTGHQEIAAFVAPFWPVLDSLVFELLNVSATGNVVFTERVDKFRFKNGATLDLPVTGVFEMDGAGKIAKWREYWDLATWTRQGGPTP